MNRKNYIVLKILSALIVSVFLFTSCNQTKKLRKSDYPDIRIKKLLKSNDSTFVDEEILDIKFSVKYEGREQNQNATCYVRNYKDSIIWISLRSMSFEGMRILLTPDSVKFVDRMNKKYFAGKYESLKEVFMIKPDFNLIEGLLRQERFEYDDLYSDARADNYKSCDDSLFYCLILKAVKPNKTKNLNPFTPGWVEQIIKISPANHKIKQNELNSTLTRESLHVNYPGENNTKNNYYPGEININFNGRNKFFINLKTKRCNFNEKVKTPFKIPENYEFVDF